jgi:ferrous iron transport protein B
MSTGGFLMHCHQSSKVLSEFTHSDRPTLILVGNPNVGKSVFFNSLTGTYVDVSNFPGTTVDITMGVFEGFTVIDTPGVYGISAFNDEEKVTRDSIIYADLVLNVVDAVHLERDLFLTQQIIDMGKSVVVALNMYDELKKANIEIDIDALSKALGVPVIPTSATKGFGMDQIKIALRKGGMIGNPVIEIEPLMKNVIELVDSRAEALLLLEEDEYIIIDHQIKKKNACRECIYKLRRNYVNSLFNAVYSIKDLKPSFLEKFGNLMIKPSTGFPILVAILAIIFTFIGVVVAQGVVGVTEGLIMDVYYKEFILKITSSFLNPDNFIGNMLIGEYGLLTMVPIYLFGLLLPLVIGFNFMMSILEDSGLLPRIAVLLDRLFTFLGLNGRAVIPMILGFGCVTMALISTRILGSKRERIIATVLLCVAVPCSAQFGVIIGIAATISLKYTLVYILAIILVFAFLGVLLNKLLPGTSTDLLIDIPSVRIPVASNIIKKTFQKAKHFIIDAGPMFALGSVIVSILSFTNSFPRISSFFAPITVHFLKLPEEVTNVFIMGIIRRDFGAAGLYTLVENNVLSEAQTVVALVVITLFVPCIASIMVLFKERKPLDAALIWLGSFTSAFLVGGIVSFFIV